MFEYHGWARIADTPGWEDDDGPTDPRHRRSSALIRERVEQLSGYALLRFDTLNGELFLHLAGMPNHRGTHGERILQLFRDVAATAPGSYGLLYVHDDEDQAGNHNTYRVYRMARGQVTEHADPFLSPLVPTVEDPAPESWSTGWTTGGGGEDRVDS